MAAVLGGLGKGNKIVVGEAGEAGEDKTLVQATVWWTNALDRYYAQEWTKNVTHELFDDAVFEPTEANSEEEGVVAEAQT
ncbi:hypothetical protein NPX13_g1861 [Xylaria arbuscula]|uniref:Uncharacterized protein n=1 Tax=Xylaria arbuscula TaxID=114810 RepID=A0A9W8NLA3_9PEZI|nr:hypothetical protein NPX13_g1861 [Xylaria arbuscula]